MEDLLGWMLILGICFGVYVLVRLSRLSAEVEDLKSRVARLLGREPGAAPLQSLADSLDARLGLWQPRTVQRMPAPPGLGPGPQAASSAPPVRPPQPEFIVDIPKPPVITTPPVTPAPLPVARAAAAQPVSASAAPHAAPHAAPAAPRAPVRPAQPLPATPAQPFDIESVVGANWMAKLGIAAIAVSVAFFLQYAFRNGWIKPWGQVGIGLCGAVLMMGAGQILLNKERFRTYAQVLFSGGIVVYFLSIYAAYSFYHPALMGYWPAFGALAIGAIAASALALANGTEAVAVICILGAFAAPALIREGGATTSDGLLKLYVYLAAINLWAAAFIRFRAWYSVAVTSFMCTWILFLAAGPVAHGGWRVEAFATLFLLSAVWTGVKALSAPAVEEEEGAGSLRMAGVAVIIAGCLAFVFTSGAILADSRSIGLPDFAVVGAGVGLLLAALAGGLPDTGRDDRPLRNGFAILSSLASGGVMAVAFLQAPAVPASMVASAFGFSVLNYGVFLAMALWLGERDETSDSAALLAGVNAAVHVLTTLHVLAGTRVLGADAACLWLPVAGLSSLAGVWLCTRRAESRTFLPAMLGIAALALPLVALIRMITPGETRFVAHWPAAASWILALEFLLASGVWTALRKRLAWPQLRLDVLGAFSTSATFFAMMAWAAGAERYHGLSILAAWSIGLAVWHGLIGGLALSSDEDDGLLKYTHLGLVVTFLAVAIPLQLKMAWITVAWAVEAAAVTWAGCAAGSKTVRQFGYTVLTVALFRAIFVDLLRPVEPFEFLLNSRMLAGSVMIASVYASAWMLWRSKEDLDRTEIDLPPGLALLANLLTLVFVSLELWERFGPRTGGAGALVYGHLALTLFWCLYAVGAAVVGSVLECRPMRSLAACLVTIAAVKAVAAEFLIAVPHFRFLLNERTLAGAAVIVSAYATAVLVRRHAEDVESPEAPIPGFLVLLANAFTLLFVSADLWQQFGLGGTAEQTASVQHVALTVFWSLYALVAVWAGTAWNRQAVRVLGVSLLAVAAAKVIAVDFSLDPARFALLLNARMFAGLAVITSAYLCAWLLWEKREETTESEQVLPGALALLGNAYTLAFVSRDLWQHFGGQTSGVVSAQQLALSIFWALYGLVAICVGIWTRKKTLRLFSMGLLYVAIFKVFLYDLGQLQTPYRIASFFTLGVVFLLVSYLYTRFEERMRDDGSDYQVRKTPRAPRTPRTPAPPQAGVTT